MIYDRILASSDAIGPARMEATVIPTGGLISFRFLGCGNDGPWSFTRTAAGSAAVTILHVGEPLTNFIDLGDGLNTPLDQRTPYSYQLVTPMATISFGPIVPAGGLTIEPDGLTRIMLRAYQAAFASLTLPAAWQRPSVIYAMPVRGQPSLPIISFAQDTVRDTQWPIGENVTGYLNQPTDAITEMADRRFRVTALALSSDERGFYRDAILGIFKSILGPLLAQLGQNVTHGFHAVDSQVTGDTKAPGFYFSEVSLQFSGSFSVHVTPAAPGVFQAIGISADPAT